MGFLDKHIPTLEGKDAERFLEMARQNEEGANTIDFSEQIKAFEKIMKNSSLYNKKDFMKEPANMIEGLADEPQEKMVSLNKVCELLKNIIDDDVLVKCGSVIKCMDVDDFVLYFREAMEE